MDFEGFQTMVYDTQNYWVLGLCSFCGILNNKKTRHFGKYICFRPQVGERHLLCWVP
jgi:hypothetical protein